MSTTTARRSRRRPAWLLTLMALLGLGLVPIGAQPASAGDGSAQLSLPWATGESWTLLPSGTYPYTGAHNWDGTSTTPASSLDFTKSSGIVRAAANGTVHRNDCSGGSAGYVRIDHGNGWQTTYYHLTSIPAGLTDGSTVSRGDTLGTVGTVTTACGGTASGAHFHFTVWHPTGAFTMANPGKTNNQASLFGLDIGGWNIQWNASLNKTCLVRISDGLQKCVGDAIYNDGTIGSGGSSPSHKADIVSYETSSNSFHVGLSTGSGFGWQPSWLSGIASPLAFGVGDFNNDGKADIVSYESDNCFRVGLSTSSNFGSWGNGWLCGVAQPTKFGVGDFNNDGRTDIVSYELSNNSFHVGLSTGSSFGWQTWLTGIANPLAFGVGDLNGDGKADIVSYESDNCFRVGLSTGTVFGSWGNGWVCGVAQPTKFGVGDFNNDGKADIVSYELSNNSFHVGLSTGSSFGWQTWLTGIANPLAFGVGDLNGDGKADIVSYESDNCFRSGLSTGANFGSWGNGWVCGVEQPAAFGVGDVNGQ